MMKFAIFAAAVFLVSLSFAQVRAVKVDGEEYEEGKEVEIGELDREEGEEEEEEEEEEEGEEDFVENENHEEDSYVDGSGAKCDRCDRRRIGKGSGVGDGNTSVATCPEGYLPLQCMASDPKRSDGTFVDGRNCTVVNSEGGKGQRAIAVCVKVVNGTYVFVKSNGFQKKPIAKCPSGTRIVGCNLVNTEAHRRVIYPKIQLARNKCVTDRKCSKGEGCCVQAVCRGRIEEPVEL